MNFKSALGLLLLLFCIACSEGQKLEEQDGFAVLPAPKKTESVATYAGGCFWAMQESLLQLKGVNKVISGYAGGTKANPTYEEVLSKNTGHAESVHVYYDPQKITFKQLTEAFFTAHDPTQLGRQGPDVGSDYRSIAFYRSAEEYKIIDEVIKRIDSSKTYDDRIVTELLPFEVFYPAEMKHQDYYPKNSWEPYVRNVCKPKVLKVRKSFPDQIKPSYLK